MTYYLPVPTLSPGLCCGSTVQCRVRISFLLGEGPVLFIHILNIARVPGPQKIHDMISVKKGSHNYTCGHSYFQRYGRTSTEFAGNEAYGCWGPLYKIAPGSASPCLGRAPLLSFIFSNERVVLYCGKPTYRFLYNPNARILFLPPSFHTFKWERHFRIPLSLVSGAYGNNSLAYGNNRLRWLFEMDLPWRTWHGSFCLPGAKPAPWESALCVHPKSFVQYQGLP